MTRRQSLARTLSGLAVVLAASATLVLSFWLLLFTAKLAGAPLPGAVGMIVMAWKGALAVSLAFLLYVLALYAIRPHRRPKA